MNDKTPNIRFKGFTDDWEQRKLSGITIYRNGTGHEEKQSESGKYELINLNSISIDGGLKPSGKFIDEETETLLKDDLVMVLSDVGHGDLLGRVALIPENNRFVLNQRVALLRNNGSVDIQYLFSYINAHQTYFKKQGAGSSQLNISRGSVENFDVLLPHKDEQKKIGEYFSNLDHLITLHQRKYDQLLNIKKSMLEKMFPKNGKKVPEIRFDGFTDDWEQRKLRDEAIEMLAGGDIDKSKIVENGKYPIYANALTNDGIVGYYDDYYRVKAPAVTVTGRGDVGHAQARTVDFTPVVRLLTIRSEHDAYFLENAINNHSVIVESTGVPQLTVPQLENYMIQFPKTIEEETKIGEYFRNLDNLITLHQRKLEKLQNLKKSMLNQMLL